VTPRGRFITQLENAAALFPSLLRRGQGWLIGTLQLPPTTPCPSAR